MATSPVVRLTITPEVQEIMDYLKGVYPLLNEAEIVKLALGGFYQYLRSPAHQANSEAQDSYRNIKSTIKQRLKNKYHGYRFSQPDIDENSF
jgi:hypothetical protein